MKPEQLRSIHLFILLALGVGAAYLLGLILWPLLPAIVTSAVFAALIYPAHRLLERRLGHRSVAAFVTTGVVFFLVLLPVVGLSFLIVDQVATGFQWLSGTIAGSLAPNGRLAQLVQAIGSYLGLGSLGLGNALQNQVQQLATTVAGHTFRILSGLGGWLLQAGTALFTLYYLLRDAEGIMGALRRLIPLDADQTDALIERAREVTYATVYGNIVVAVVQGGLGGLAFFVLGLPAAALWGTVMVLLSLLPAVGAPFVWVPAGVILLYHGEVARGVALLAVGALIISTVDNVLRSILVGNRAQLHPLVVFLSVLGGLFVFGAIGFFIGPVLFVLALTVLEMARAALEPGAPGRGWMLLHPETEPRRRSSFRFPHSRPRR